MNATSKIIIDCAQLTARALAEQLRALPEDSAVKLLNHIPQLGSAGLCSGLAHHLAIEVDGHVGDMCFFLGSEAHIEVKGNSGDSLGHSMSSGVITVNGSAGNCLAAFASGGFIAVLGQAGECCAQGLCGADVFVRSRVGKRAGYAMRSGTLVLGNGAGDGLGEGMTGGEIYVRGEVPSKVAGLRQERMRDADNLRLTLFLARAGIKAALTEFKVFRPRTSETHSDTLHDASGDES